MTADPSPIPPLPAVLAETIHRLRKAAGLTQAQLAVKVGLERTSIINIEKGNQKLSVQTLVDIASALNHDIEFVFDRRRPEWQRKLMEIYEASEPGKPVSIPREIFDGIDKEFGLEESFRKALFKIRGIPLPPPLPTRREGCNYVVPDGTSCPKCGRIHGAAEAQTTEEARHEDDTDNWW